MLWVKRVEFEDEFVQTRSSICSRIVWLWKFLVFKVEFETSKASSISLLTFEVEASEASITVCRWETSLYLQTYRKASRHWTWNIPQIQLLLSMNCTMNEAIVNNALQNTLKSSIRYKNPPKTLDLLIWNIKVLLKTKTTIFNEISLQSKKIIHNKVLHLHNFIGKRIKNKDSKNSSKMLNIIQRIMTLIILPLQFHLQGFFYWKNHLLLRKRTPKSSSN